MSEGTWLQCSMVGDVMGPRFGAGSCCHEDEWYVYGGASLDDSGVNHYYNDLHCLNLAGSQVSCRQITTHGVDPGPRVGCFTFLNPQDGCVYLYGGTCNEFTLEHCRGLFRLDLSSYTWFELELFEDPGVVSQCISIHGSTLYMFGGVFLDEPCNSLFTLDLASKPLTWKIRETKGAVPEPRVDHSSAVCAGRLFVFGGSGSQVLWFNDLYCLELKTKVWTKIKVSSGVYPCPRDFCSLSAYDDKFLFLFGGSNDNIPEANFNQVWYYSLSHNAWYTCDTLGVTPPPRHAHGVTLSNDLYYVFGGLNTTTHNDVWVMQINSLRGESIKSYINSSSPPPTQEFGIKTELPPFPALTSFKIPAAKPNTGLAELKDSVIGQISKGFSELEEEIEKLNTTREQVTLQELQLKKGKEDQARWIEEQRNDLIRQCEEHTESCKEWVSRQTEQFEKERALLTSERKKLEKKQRRLAADQDVLNKRVKKLEELLNRTKIK